MKLHINEIIRRNVVKYDKTTGIFNNGADNCYPQRVERIINNSVTAKAAANKAKAFIIGNGFKDKSLNDIVIFEDINGKITLYDLLRQTAHSISRQNAASLNVQYNALYKKCGVKPMPYRNCRFGKKDSENYSGFIHYYYNWDKKPELKFNINDVEKINIYNPDERVVESQFKRGYKGQIAMLLLDDEYIYPLSQIDPSIEDADTEAQIKSFKNSELRKGFFAKYILYHTAFNNQSEQDEFKRTLKRFESGEFDSSILMAEAQFTEDGDLMKGGNFQIQKLEQNINDKLFETYEKTTSNNIRKSFWNIPSILIEQQEAAMFGQSGEAMKAAFAIYNSELKHIRKSISQWYKEIFSNFADGIFDNKDFEIEELTYTQENGTMDNSGAAGNQTA